MCHRILIKNVVLIFCVIRHVPHNSDQEYGYNIP